MVQSRANRNLLLVAFMWGTSYTFIKMAIAAQMPPSVINTLRGLISAILVYIFFRKIVNTMTWKEFKIGAVCAVFNFVVVQLQSTGLKYTTPSNSSFITSIYVILLPFIAWLFFKRVPPLKIYLSIILCVFGMIFLTGIISTGLKFHMGDFLTVLSAIFYALQMTYYGYATKNARPQILAFQLGFVQAICGVLYSFTIDYGKLPQINWTAAIGPVIYLGVVATFAAQVIQVTSQKYTDTVTAGLVLMTESLFASLVSVLFHVEPLTQHLIIGGSLIIFATLVAQFDIRGVVSRYFVRQDGIRKP
ncbi:DMT family transporter [Companilactobacillus hulinensis]|uniref:DMT family transporter n=1 Tax=Companilactobacillus hulinensis TaxID=2486007 RepID=UPI000F798967|nr:DMT family transporter [Companilactobacillus hulinensis]